MIAIKAENISKQYRLGLVGTQTLSHDLNRWWCRVRGKEDPFLTVGEVNDRSIVGESEYVWALKDINFQIEQGDNVGIVGSNGAGKSTLLKILSNVTTPTTGNVSIKGRIASLLEVGTGFHGEMTGRENIYLNGAILGMNKREISRKLDEIIEFSEVGRYIDTPVKRYSSGMYVRLAFSVAVHLDNEILIVDEVLAVGDISFQTKCIEKIKDITAQGRTVLFVSHNMKTLSKVCKNSILMDKGTIVEMGSTDDVITNYIDSQNREVYTTIKTLKLRSTELTVSELYFMQHGEQTVTLEQGEPFQFHFVVENPTAQRYSIYFNVEFVISIGEPVTYFGNEFQRMEIVVEPYSRKQVTANLPLLNIKRGKYSVGVYFTTNRIYSKDRGAVVINAFEIEVAPARKEYFANPNAKWNMFSSNVRHGFMPIEMTNIDENTENL